MSSTPQERLDYVPTGYHMIRSIELQNFRCYRLLKIDRVARLNVVVGDNGSGKTALLEGVFMALATSDLSLRFRQQRGLDSAFSAPPRRIEDAIWGELFHGFSYDDAIRLTVRGDGPVSRSLTISRGTDKSHGSGPLTFTYKDAKGVSRVTHPGITPQGIQSPDTGEDLPNFFHFPANAITGSVETAGRFSDLSKRRQHEDFIRIFVEEYKWLEDLNIEVVAGSAAIYGTQFGARDKIALANISGGMNRITAILLAIASREKAIVLVDEIENGVYYRHQPAIWRGLLKFLRERDGQMICTTHSKEWLESLIEAAGDNVDDIALWRVERGAEQPTVRQFSGSTLRAGLEHGAEVRSNE